VVDPVLVDTSVWISHFRFGEERLASMLEDQTVACHPFVIGEIACGTLKNRGEILSLLGALPMALSADQDEILGFIENNRLMGVGLGFVDVHLLGAAVLSDVPLWTFDKRLAKAARRLGVGLGP
jgi:predicted nucleic acid-binding protein